MGNCISDALGDDPNAPRRAVAHAGCYIPAHSRLPRQQNGATNTDIEPSEPTQAQQPSEEDAARLLPELAPFRLDERKVVTTRKVGGSSSGYLWLGHYLDQPVIVKRFFMYQEEVARLSNEIKDMARLQHPKIARFIGCTWTSEKDLGAVSEYVDGGTLRSLLEKSTVELNWAKEKIAIAIDIAEALAYMHSLSPVVLHNDLKSHNVLLDASMEAKLSNFGLGRHHMHPVIINFSVIPWTAPEVFRGEGNNYSARSDVYSLGALLSELDTREVPFKKERSDRSAPPARHVVDIALNKLHPSFTPDCPDVILQIGRACLQFDATLRPSSDAVVKMLVDARSQLQSLTDPQPAAID